MPIKELLKLREISFKFACIFTHIRRVVASI